LISTYYGTYDDGVHCSRKDFTALERLLKNKLCGEGQNIRCLTIQKMGMQIKVIKYVEFKINKKNHSRFVGTGKE